MMSAKLGSLLAVELKIKGRGSDLQVAPPSFDWLASYVPYYWG